MSLSHLQTDFLLEASEREWFSFIHQQLLLFIVISGFSNITLSLLSHPLHRADAGIFHIPAEDLTKCNVLRNV
jgi:hypothetical protein